MAEVPHIHQSNDRENKTMMTELKVKEHIMKGWMYNDLVDAIVNDIWGIGLQIKRHSAKNLITRVRKQIIEDFKDEQQAMREQMVSRIFKLHENCIENNDRATALNCLKELNKMTGLYEPIKNELKIDSDIIVNFGFSNTPTEEGEK